MVAKWKYNLLTGNELIDKQHKEIFDKANEMVSASRKGNTIEAGEKMIDYLEAYYKNHFVAEEGLMDIYPYPKHQAHLAAHGKFFSDLMDLKLKHHATGASYALALETAIFMLKWLAEHIDRVDKEFAAHVRKVQTDQRKAKVKSTAL